MKHKIVLFISISLLLFSCNINEKPEFNKVKSVKIVNQSTKEIEFLVNLEFNNPNLLGGTFHSENLRFFINDYELSQLKTEQFEVPANDIFEMPVFIKLDKESIKGNTLEIISKLAQIAFTKNIDLTVKGDLNYKVMGYSNAYKIDYQEKIDLSKK